MCIKRFPSNSIVLEKTGASKWLSPLQAGRTFVTNAPAAALFDRAIEQAVVKIQRTNRFQNAQQRREVVDLFRKGQATYSKL